jgi:DNA-binding NarL/FixJ family response regulator
MGMGNSSGGAFDVGQAMSETRILIADDHAVVRSGLRALLEAQPGWTVVAEAGDGRDALAKALETKPDVAIIDYSLPLLNGAEVTRQIHARLPSVEVLIFTMHDSDSLVTDILAAGARAYLLKSDANQYLIAAVASLADHKPFFTGKVSEQLLDSYLSHQSRSDGLLSPRERVIVQLIAEGNSNRDMGEALGLSVKTIETHRASLMRKLKLKSTAAIVRYAIRNRLVEP